MGRYRRDVTTCGETNELRQEVATPAVVAEKARMRARAVTYAMVLAIALAFCACGTSDAKTYDISPIFPLSTNKCATYEGTVQGSGLTAHCWVTKPRSTV